MTLKSAKNYSYMRCEADHERLWIKDITNGVKHKFKIMGWKRF